MSQFVISKNICLKSITHTLSMSLYRSEYTCTHAHTSETHTYTIVLSSDNYGKVHTIVLSRLDIIIIINIYIALSFKCSKRCDIKNTNVVSLQRFERKALYKYIFLLLLYYCWPPLPVPGYFLKISKTCFFGTTCIDYLSEFQITDHTIVCPPSWKDVWCYDVEARALQLGRMCSGTGCVLAQNECAKLRDTYIVMYRWEKKQIFKKKCASMNFLIYSKCVLFKFARNIKQATVVLLITIF